MNLLSLSMTPYSFISVLLSPKIESFFKKLSTMNNKSGLFLSSIASRDWIIYLFFIFLSIYKSSAKFRSKWKATKRTFSCFLIMIASLFSSFFMYKTSSSYSSYPSFCYISLVFCLNSLTLTMYLLISCSMILIVVSPI